MSNGFRIAHVREKAPFVMAMGSYTASLFLPFLLLLLKMFLPAFVLIRDKKPKVLFLFTLLGWYVLFKSHPFFNMINDRKDHKNRFLSS